MDDIIREELDTILEDDPTLCFCKIPAYRSFTLEHGPILECGKYDAGPLIYCGTAEEIKQKAVSDIEKKMTCGFHVHEISWNLLRRDMRNGKIIPSDANELKACSLYNLSYCSSFYLENDSIKEKLTSTLECFCGQPVALRAFPVRLDGGVIRNELRFTCQESRNPNAIKKCNWRVPFKKAAILRPITPSHTVVDIITYYDLVNQRLVHSHTVESQHRRDLLATLIANSSDYLSTLSTDTTLDEREINQHYPTSSVTQGHSFYATNIYSPSTNYSYDDTPVVSYDLEAEERSELCILCLGSGVVNSGYPCQHCGL